jgi:probable phosphoglycerate mutase
MSEIVLIRPGCTDFELQNRIQGSLDLPLNLRGRAEVHDIVDQLQGLPLQCIYTSPSEPAHSTAAAIGDNLGIPVKESDDLRNVDQGLWEGLQIDEIRRKYPKVFKQWEDAPETICPPEGEPIPTVIERVRKALRKPMKRKLSFAIVASEPLATLISCIVRDCKPELPGSVYTSGHTRPIEVLQTNGLASHDENGKVRAGNSDESAQS